MQKKAVILGLGVSGKAVFNYLSPKYHLTCVDHHPHADIVCRSETDPIDLTDIAFLVKSPGIPYTHPLVEKATALSIPILGELDFAFEKLLSLNKIVIGITGSNGKTTTTLLIAHILEKQGMKVSACGNIGAPLLSEIRESVDAYIVEMSSFQLECVAPLPILDAALILNITPNHLDHHASFESYVHAKLQIQKCLKPNGAFYVHSHIKNNQAQNYDLLKEKVETILSLSYREGKSRMYPHDFDNFSAAYAIVRQLGISEAQFAKAAASFQKPPHRIEFVRSHKGVDYINDSKATSVDAVMKALEAVPGKIVLIAGGVDKGGSFHTWKQILQKKGRHVYAMGPAAFRIQEELAPFAVSVASCLEDAFLEASHAAQKGDTVLLSPGCSSFNQFENYQQRGERFKELVFAL